MAATTELLADGGIYTGSRPRPNWTTSSCYACPCHTAESVPRRNRKLASWLAIPHMRIPTQTRVCALCRRQRPLGLPCEKLVHAHLQPQRMAFLARLQPRSRLQCVPKAIAAGRIPCGQIPRHPSKPTTQLTRHDNLCSPANPPCADADRHWPTCPLALRRHCLRTSGMKSLAEKPTDNI